MALARNQIFWSIIAASDWPCTFLCLRHFYLNKYVLLCSLPVSSYIQEVSVTEATENITVSCTVTQSEPALICRAVFYCTGVENSASLTLSNDVAQNFMTNRMCNVTIQVTSSSDFSQVLEESFFYNISPSTSPPDSK